MPFSPLRQLARDPSCPCLLYTSIPNVPPGDYYLLAEKIGYISPGHLPWGPYYLTKEEEDSLAKQVTPITVAANRTTAVDTFLTRGASISGLVRFDDGSPYAEGLVALMLSLIHI